MIATAEKKMTAAGFRAWCEPQDRHCYERFCGEIVAMAPKRAEHGRAKANVWRALAQSIDTNTKLRDCFRVASVEHYLLVDLKRRVWRYRRRGEQIIVAFVKEGALKLDPSGVSIKLADVFA